MAYQVVSAGNLLRALTVRGAKKPTDDNGTDGVATRRSSSGQYMHDWEMTSYSARGVCFGMNPSWAAVCRSVRVLQP